MNVSRAGKSRGTRGQIRGAQGPVGGGWECLQMGVVKCLQEPDSGPIVTELHTLKG